MEEETKQIIDSIKEGNTGSFKRLVELYGSRVSNIVYHILGGSSNEVDDLAQEVFIKIYKNLGYFREKSKFSTWIYRITVNTVWDYLRKQKNRRTLSLDELEPEEPRRLSSQPENITGNLQQSELKQLINGFIQELPFKYKTVLILKEIEDLSYREIAGTLNCSIGTVESRLFRARAALKEKIQKSPLAKEILEH